MPALVTSLDSFSNSARAGAAPSSAPPAATPPAPRYETLPAWGGAARNWEVGETNRLNAAHWARAEDVSINVWIAEQLATIRARAAYEERNNPTIAGVAGTHADDIVGPDGPTLQVISDDADYNDALEEVWQSWFAAPTTRATMSGAALLKLWIRSLWKNGEFLAQLRTDPAAEGPVKLRIHPVHPRRLASPAERAGDPRVFMGIEADDLQRPRRYWISRGAGWDGRALLAVVEPWPADLVIHEFLCLEEGQGRGVPWCTPSLQPTADLRDFDDKIQDAATAMTDQSALLFCRQPDTVWMAPEEMTVQRRTVKMAPPGWEPWAYPATQPPVQYPDYRAEKHRDVGRPVGMPNLIVRMDASKHSWASARIDTTHYGRSIGGLQSWLSGSPSSTGTLNRLVDEVAREARFSDRRLRVRPRRVLYHWTWTQIPAPQPEVDENAAKTALSTGTQTLTEILARRKKTLATHIQERQREVEAFTAAGLPVPPWATGQAAPPPAAPAANDEKEEEEEPANAGK